MSTDSSNQNQTSNYHDDEIDLRDLILPLFQHKWLILAIAVACTMLGATYHLGRYTFTYPEQHHLPIAFVFSGANEGEFPNGDKFSANDVIASQIIRRVYDGNTDLADAVSYNNFVEAISISYGFSAVEFLESYVSDLADSDRKVTVEQFNERVEQYMQVLSQKSRSTATITLNNSELRLSDIVIAQVLPNIVSDWATYSINQRGVLNKFSTFSTSTIPVDINNQDIFLVVNILDDIAKTTAEQLDLFALEPGANSFTAPGSEYSYQDLRTELELLIKYQLNLTKSLVTNEILTSSNTENSLRGEFVGARLKQLKSRESELTRIIAVYEESIDQFDKLVNSATVADSSVARGTTIYSPQYNENFVNTMLDLGSKLADPEFRKQLIQKKIEIATDLEDVRTEIALFDTSSSGTGTINNELLQNELLQDVTSELNNIKLQLERILSESAKLIQAYNENANNNSAELYQSLGDVEKIEGYKLINSSIIKILAAAFVLGLFLGVIVVFVRKMLAAPRLS